MAKGLKLELDHDTSKTLNKGKRRYKDDENHNIYLSGDEVKKLGEPDTITVTLTPAG
jgi:hypothetical protein